MQSKNTKVSTPSRAPPRARTEAKPGFVLKHDESLPEWAKKPFWEEANPQESQVEREERIQHAIDMTMEADSTFTEKNGSDFTISDLLAAGLTCSWKPGPDSGEKEPCEFSAEAVESYSNNKKNKDRKERLWKLVLGYTEDQGVTEEEGEDNTEDRFVQAYESLVETSNRTGIPRCHIHSERSKYPFPETTFLGTLKCGHVFSYEDRNFLGRPDDAPCDRKNRPIHYSSAALFSQDGKVCRHRQIGDSETETVKFACSAEHALLMLRSLNRFRRGGKAKSDQLQITNSLNMEGSENDNVGKLPVMTSADQPEAEPSHVDSASRDPSPFEDWNGFHHEFLSNMSRYPGGPRVGTKTSQISHGGDTGSSWNAINK